MKILKNAVWMNIHSLPVITDNTMILMTLQHEVAVFEVRHRESYGARWSADGSEFRGFLEPQMEGSSSSSPSSSVVLLLL
jgi:hypothetical protein